MAESAQPPICEARDVSVAYDLAQRKLALADASMSVSRGEIVAILGPSGCGKSTLLRTLIGLQKPTSGEVLADGQPLAGIHPRATLVFQSFALYPWLTVRANIAVALEGLGLSPADGDRRIAHCIDLIGLEGFEEAYPKELSGGMKQRVGFARALARAPALLCMDEPFSALDVFTAESLRREVYRLMMRVGKRPDGPAPELGVQSVLLITHNIEEAVFLADRVVVMGPGRIRQIVPIALPHPRDYNAPAFQSAVQRLRSAFVTELLGEPVGAPRARVAKLEPLPAVTLGEVIGVLELLRHGAGAMDVFELDELTDYDFGRTLGVIKAGEMLHLVDTPGNRVQLTEIGQALLVADTSARKETLHRQLSTLKTFQLVLRILGNADETRLPREVVVEQLAMCLPSADPEQLFDTIVDWARYAELFGYEPETSMLYIDQSARA